MRDKNDNDTGKVSKREEQTRYIVQGLILSLLTWLPLFIGFIIMTLTVDINSLLGFRLGSFIAGFSGVIIILRKEIPYSLGRIQGKRAIIEGAFFHSFSGVLRSSF